ncbi:hypothetical protein TNCV_539611 [Trichonephila clavipes]|nr:hypothetical protein TNCV_539611 [Trichonephila clavipes]
MRFLLIYKIKIGGVTGIGPHAVSFTEGTLPSSRRGKRVTLFGGGGENTSTNKQRVSSTGSTPNFCNSLGCKKARLVFAEF